MVRQAWASSISAGILFSAQCFSKLPTAPWGRVQPLGWGLGLDSDHSPWGVGIKEYGAQDDE